MPAFFVCDQLDPVARRSQLAFGAHPLGDVTDEAGEAGLPGRLGPCNSELDRKLGAVRAQRSELDAVPEDAGLAGAQITSQAPFVRLTVRGRHDEVGQRPADSLAGVVPKGA